MHEVFICHSSHDKTIANALCTTLESMRIKCWIAPRDVPFGIEYPEAVVKALSESQAVVLVLSTSSNNSPRVLCEVGEAAGKAIPIIPFKIEELVLSETMEHFINNQHLSGTLAPLMDKPEMQGLAEMILQILPGREEKVTSTQIEEPAPKEKAEGLAPQREEQAGLSDNGPSGTKNKKNLMWWILGIGLPVLLIIFYILSMGKG